jgi:NAD(P)-dependent dehydrogenase (short-subunit alcohol dehydrogenase family)
MNDWRLEDRTILVTGASSGIGRETVEGLARLGSRVLMLGRDASRLDAARQRIQRRVPRARLQLYVADLASLGQVRRVAETVRDQHPVIDVLINNAAVITRTRELTEDGIETQWAVNHLAPFLLTHLLFEALVKADRARVITVASAAEVLGRIAFDDLGGAERYDSRAAYCQSKLANVMFTYALARRLPPHVTANCLHPGAIRTRLLTEYLGGPGVSTYLRGARYPGPAAGARQTVSMAMAPELDGVSGRYFADGRVQETSAASRVVADQERLWAESERQVALSAAERLPFPINADARPASRSPGRPRP